jgi:hypothetical protein
MRVAVLISVSVCFSVSVLVSSTTPLANGLFT